MIKYFCSLEDYEFSFIYIGRKSDILYLAV
jgi:hypothetical protein